MNLTSKRMLQVLSVCVGAVALTASAQTVWVADTFEAEGPGYTNAAIGSVAGLYKAHIWDDGIGQFAWTNLCWSATSGDTSTIQQVEGLYAQPRPITDANAQAQVLKLETEGQTLTRYVNFIDGEDHYGTVEKIPAPITLGVAPVYVDTLIKFTPSEDDPEITDNQIKLALWVNINSNLVVRHQYMELPDGAFTVVTNTVFTDVGVINPEQWYRLTVELKDNPWWGDPIEDPFGVVFSIRLDGVELTHAEGLSYDSGAPENPVRNGPLFWAVRYDEYDLSQVSFQGTGFVDDLVVADTHAPFPSTGLTLTLVFDDGLLDVTADGTPVENNAEINSGATLAISAVDWYQITSVTGEGITYNGTPAPGEQVKASTGAITADEPGRTATIAAAQYTGTIATGLTGNYANIDATKLAAWAVKSSLTETQVGANAADYLDNYLLNIDESIDANIKIDSIVIDAENDKAIITVVASHVQVDLTDLNGRLLIYTTEDLTSDWGEPDEYLIDWENSTGEEVVIEVPHAAGNFIKARVE